MLYYSLNLKDKDDDSEDYNVEDFLGPDLDPDDPDDRAELDERIEDWFSK